MKLLLVFGLLFSSLAALSADLSGRIISVPDKADIPFATVVLVGTQHATVSNDEGIFRLSAPAGTYTLQVSSVGYVTYTETIKLTDNEPTKVTVKMHYEDKQLGEVVVSSNSVRQLNRTAYNAVGIDTKALLNSNSNLSDALRQAPGMKIREAGGVGSDMNITLDGFSGRHVKIFIDGVPQEGTGASFSLGNIPAGYADHIEVYRGVVPVGFGSDAIGGVINIVTKKKARRWFLDASYSYGSFNTHKWNVDWGQTFGNGLTYEINAFQNYSDNSYKIDATGVKHFLEGGGSTQNSKLVERVKRFHDNYHNEAFIGRIGVLNKEWADRLMFCFTYSQLYKEVQTDARQSVAFGERYRRGHSLMPSVEYRKHNLAVEGLDLVLTGNYNRNYTNNVDTATYEFNWLGESRYLKGAKGEANYQDTKTYDDNFNVTACVKFNIATKAEFLHSLTLSNVLNTMSRETETVTYSEENDINKVTSKDILGLSYQISPSHLWNVTLFSKYYQQSNRGPMAESSSDNTSYVEVTRTSSIMGYGSALSVHPLKILMCKLSYEKACRLPTIDELFGDNDLESGEFELRPETSHNINVSIIYDAKLRDDHGLYAEAGVGYRHTMDYIKRTVSYVSVNSAYYGTYSNHGEVVTKLLNATLRYSYKKWLTVGGTFSIMDARDNEKYQSEGSLQANLSYGARMPNLPYRFWNSDATLRWHDLGGVGNTLSCIYDNTYTHSFPLYSEVLGKSSTKMTVPTQFAHNLSLSYSIKRGKYNVSLMCQNLTNEKLYDNFNLQKAGRALYGKIRVALGNK